MKKGKVKTFNEAKGYGFITEDDTKDDLFFHFSELDMKGFKTINNGEKVSFESVIVNNKKQAKNIKKLLS